MADFRLSQAASDDIVSMLAVSSAEFGEDASRRYQALIAAAIRDLAAGDGLGRISRPELGQGVFTWHLSQSRDHVSGQRVRRPRHVLVCRWDGTMLVVVRVLHDTMDYRRHVDTDESLA